jgi:hypothetical protein
LGNISEFFGETGEKGKGVFLADEKKVMKRVQIG